MVCLNDYLKKSRMPANALSKSDKTRSRILEAATQEFAALGIAGARMDRIAAHAKANKSLIYEYFGNKETLFRKVMERQIELAYETISFSVDNLPQYAVHLFDFAMDHPQLMRLLVWQGLDENCSWPEEGLTSFATHTATIAEKQKQGRIDATFPAPFLLTLIFSLAVAWTESNPFGMSIWPHAQEDREQLRTLVAQAVERLCLAQKKP